MAGTKISGASTSARPLPAERLSALRRFLLDRPGQVVSSLELADHFGVSIQTVRRDLVTLESDGSIARVFGGARVAAPETTVEPEIAVRKASSLRQKAAIGLLASTLLRAGEAAYFDASTTVMELITRIPLDWDGGATTSSLPAAYALARRTTGHLTLLGGEYRRGSECVGGSTTVDQLSQMRFGTAYLSSRAFSLRHGFTEANPDEAALKQAVIRNADRVIMLVDSTKTETVAAHHFVALDTVDAVITDDDMPQELIDMMRSHTTVQVAHAATRSE